MSHPHPACICFYQNMDSSSPPSSPTPGKHLLMTVDGAHERKRKKRVTFPTRQAICSHLAVWALIILDSGCITTDVSNFHKGKALLSGINDIDKLEGEGKESKVSPTPTFHLWWSGCSNLLHKCLHTACQHLLVNSQEKYHLETMNNVCFMPFAPNILFVLKASYGLS